MSREQRRRLLLRAHAAAKRFCKKAEADPYYRPATEAFVAGWLLGYRAHRRDTHDENLRHKFIAMKYLYQRCRDTLHANGHTAPGDGPTDCAQCMYCSAVYYVFAGHRCERCEVPAVRPTEEQMKRLG